MVPIGERIRALRSERGWSQEELATKISAAGAHQISRYENAKITPATDTVVRLAEIFDVSIDYLLLDSAPRRPLHVPDRGLADRLSVELAELNESERDSVLLFVEALQAKARLKTLAAGLR